MRYAKEGSADMKTGIKSGVSKTLDQEQWAEWNENIFSLFWKIWLVTLAIELLLFLFYQPTEECSRLYYFYLFILTPSGLELIVLSVFQLVFQRLVASCNRIVVSIYTIFLISAFAGITVCVHTSVELLPSMLLLPMILTPLYQSRWLTLFQAFLLVLLYIADQFYFIPNSPYMPASNEWIDICVFIGSMLAMYLVLLRVNKVLVRNQERSRRDSLTHLYNHEFFYEQLDEHRKSFAQNGSAFSVIIADIDDFKQVNDTYGHAFGDEVIQKVGEIFSANAPKKAICARYGGEEFAMVIPNGNPDKTAEQIRKAFAETAFSTMDGTRHFTLSLGTAVCTRPYDSATAFFEEADQALYLAKRSGKNCVKQGERW